MNDPFAVLGLPRDATEDAIKTSYRRLAMEWHPDRNSSPEAGERFRAIQEAYDILKDPTRREAARTGGANHHTFHFGFGHGAGHPFEPEDIDQFFRRHAMRNPDAVAMCDISLEEAFGGRTIEVTVRTPHGMSRVDVRIPPGIDDGQRLRIPGKGGTGIPSAPPGDLYLTVHVRPHPRFGRQGQNLVLPQKVDVFTAMLGGEIVVEGIDGATLRAKIPERTQPGQRMRLNGQGMPIPGTPRRGDLFVQIDVELPELNERQRDMIRTIAGMANNPTTVA